ncbi:DUF3196 family protein [Mycoplasma sp. E35C]|uniref:DUF3196 family protein n=1 Tax=Mycoplasma sp. E35C TaxID=2801918 RepID=UPI001CA3A29B|nr:DUF3196 family protein [Mycoplasma sp. E35C]QZX49455.1 DUF3196 family protein [Mycoplasma sp. E35C]
MKPNNLINDSELNFNSIDEIINHLKNDKDISGDESKKFYISLLELINQDVHKKAFKKALSAVQEELDTDYLPFDLIKYFVQASYLIKRKMYESEFDWLEKLEKQELINKTIINFSDNLWYFDYLATKNSDYWESDDFEFFRPIFIAKTYDNASKLMAAQLLQNIEAFHDLEFKVYNNKLKQNFDVKLTKDNIWSDGTENYFNAVLDDIETHFYKDPSKDQLAGEIVNNIMLEYYPSYCDLAKPKELSTGIIQYVKNCFDNQKPNHKIDPIIYDLIHNTIN